MRICPWLLIHGVEPCLWSYHLSGSRQTLGRSSACVIRLLHASVSRCHAEIRQQGGRFYIQDLKSRNGTFVNGQAVTEADFNVGDTLSLAAVTLEVVASPLGLASSPAKTALAMPPEVRDWETTLHDLRAVYGLSPAEYQVLRLLVLGLSEKAVANRLHLSRHTVHAHAKRIYHAVGVHSRAELLATTWVGESAESYRRRPLTG